MCSHLYCVMPCLAPLLSSVCVSSPLFVSVHLSSPLFVSPLLCSSLFVSVLLCLSLFSSPLFSSLLSIAHPPALDASLRAEAGPGPWDPHRIVGGLGAVHLSADPCLWGCFLLPCERGRCTTHGHASLCLLATFLGENPSLLPSSKRKCFLKTEFGWVAQDVFSASLT